mmetsp:Transcript_18899/g.32629  ORF Transcript_18899/g.32629 Transcript_18899/m.32629 type:complete len:83 (+) Transcript_18899:41-289(+)
MGLSFYKAAGRAHRIRGHITYTLSPLVQNPMKNMFSIKYNIGRAKQKFNDNAYTILPIFGAFFGTVWWVQYAEKKNDRNAWF